MPIDNLGKIHFSDQQIDRVQTALTDINTVLIGLSENLTSIERRNYGKVGEKNKLIIDKVKDYHNHSPALQSPDVDWNEFEKDYKDRQVAWQMLAQVRMIEKLLMNIKILRDHDNYTDALRDYRFAQYKNGFGNQSGFQTKIDSIKPFFSKTGKTKK